MKPVRIVALGALADEGTVQERVRLAAASPLSGARSTAKSARPITRRRPAALVLAACVSVLACQPEPWGGVLSSGPHPVGFKAESVVRVAADGQKRSLRIVTWYPAASGEAREMRLSDLLDEVRAENQLEDIQGLSNPQAWPVVLSGDRAAIPEATTHRQLNSTTWARLDALPAAGSFPVVMFSSRHATVLAQAPLAEVLASQGLVVVSVWSSDPPLAFIWEDRPTTEKLETVAAQTDDLDFALEHISQRSEVDRSRVVVVAWSYGGQTAARIQERLGAVRGLIGLDANVLPSRPEESFELRKPTLLMVGQDTTRRGVEWLDEAKALAAPIVMVRLKELAHGNFNAMEGLLPELVQARTFYRWSKGGKPARAGYRVITDIVSRSVSLMLGETPPLASNLKVAATGAGASAGLEVEVRGRESDSITR